MPAIAVSVNSSAWVNGKPRFSICTVMIPHMPQTAKPHSSAGTEIAEVAVGDPLAGASPRIVVLGAPVGDVGAAARARRCGADSSVAFAMFMAVPCVIEIG